MVIRKLFAGVIRALTTSIYASLHAALFERTFLAKRKHALGSAALTVDFFKRNVKSKPLLIKALRLSAQVIVVFLCRDIGNTL